MPKRKRQPGVNYIPTAEEIVYFAAGGLFMAGIMLFSIHMHFKNEKVSAGGTVISFAISLLSVLLCFPANKTKTFKNEDFNETPQKKLVRVSFFAGLLGHLLSITVALVVAPKTGEDHSLTVLVTGLVPVFFLTQSLVLFAAPASDL
ncbi:MAG: uncharacterized protein A8A55_2433 [Amphiamblys sp. WSBS2006]|nr:MAG: uncharacterized protein A8A55_2433 [Amphiamblys sp. WSBS2006]